jgi:hypothetical protein
MADEKKPAPVDGQPGAEQTPEYNDALRKQLVRDREYYKNFPEQLAAVDARLAELGEPAAGTEEQAGEPTDTGSGSYEDRTVAQLKATAEKKGIDVSGLTTKDDLIAAIREG